MVKEDMAEVEVTEEDTADRINIKANKRENIGIPILRVNDKPITNDRDKA